MTLHDLIAEAQAMRAEHGETTSVLLLTSRGYAHPMLVDGLGFGRRTVPVRPSSSSGPLSRRKQSPADGILRAAFQELDCRLTMIE